MKIQLVLCSYIHSRMVQCNRMMMYKAHKNYTTKQGLCSHQQIPQEDLL